MARSKRKKGFFRKLVSWLFKIILALIVSSFIYVIICKWIDPPITITEINSIIKGNGLTFKNVSIQKINSDMKLAVIAGEDQLFMDHNGFDFASIQKALKHNQKSKSLRGASTISQQTAKNVFLWQHGGFFRKALEVYFTFMIEKIWGKKRILEVYLNVAETGKGIFGVQAAAKKYFKTSASNLTAFQAALIASSLPNPDLFTVVPLSGHVAIRSQWIIRQMNNLRTDEDIDSLIH